MIKNIIKSVLRNRNVYKKQNYKQIQYKFSTKQTQESQEDIDAEKKFQEQERLEKEQKKRDFEQNRLKFIFIAASLGGTLVGSCLAYLLQGQKPEESNQVEEVKNNLLDFKGEWNYNWDNRHNLYQEALQKQSEEQLQEIGVRHIYLVRHGQYVHAEESKDKKLTKLGQQQAQLLGKRLKQLANFDKIYVSDMVRAKETCDIVMKELKTTTPVIEDPSLAEGYPCDVSPAHASINKYFQKYKLPQSQVRIQEAFEKYIHRSEDFSKDSHELYVIHGNVIRYFMTRALQFPVEGWLRMATANCGITHFKIFPNGTVKVQNFGDSGHLAQDQITFN